MSGPLERRVVVREENYTEMWVPNAEGCRAFARQLIRDGKAFKCEPCTDEGWSVTVYEHNHPNRWEYA